MKKNIFIILLLLFISCKNKGQNYNYELEDSDESYVMDSWSNNQKEDYYSKAGNLVKEVLTFEHFNVPNQSDFNKSLYDKLGIKLNSNQIYQILPHHIFEQDSLDGYAQQLIIFPSNKIVSLKTELPLLNKSSLQYYKSNDFKNLDHSMDYNIVINKLLFSPNDKEIDLWLKDKQLDELFNYLVCSFHFEDKKIFQYVIKKLIKETDTKNNKLEYLQLLFKRDIKLIDSDFLRKIAILDVEKKMYMVFKSLINSEGFSLNEQRNFQNEIDKIYEQKETVAKAPDIYHYLKKDYQIIDIVNADLDDDQDDDIIYIAASEKEITNLQILIFNNDKSKYLLWAKNDSSPIIGQKEYKKTVTKGNYFTIEYTRDIEDKYNLYNYLTFKLQNTDFLLHRFSQETFDVQLDKNLLMKTWTNKNFGNINFENVSFDHIDRLK